ncbi:MAG TPA: hypothetical protein VGN64_23105 [Dyadobacter sp.]|nr:hypothetical protein [Dyadobacter sp.]
MTQPTSEPVIRPMFLTVLCFITFMNSVSGLWSQSERFWNPGVMADKTRETFETVRESVLEQANGADIKTMETMFSAVIDNTTPQTIMTGAVIMLLFEALSLYGAYLMWKLQKQGYYFYLGGMAVAFLAPIFFIGGWLGFITAFASIFASIFMAIFYALNLKYMR